MNSQTNTSKPQVNIPSKMRSRRAVSRQESKIKTLAEATKEAQEIKNISLRNYEELLLLGNKGKMIVFLDLFDLF